MRPGATLLPGERLTSEDEGTSLTMQEDGNLVLTTRGAVRWASGTRGAGAGAVLQQDGNLVVYDRDVRPLWSTGTRRSAGSGDVVLRVEDREARLWETGSESAAVIWGTAWESSTLEPGQALRPGDRRTAPGGRVVLVQQVDGNLVQLVDGVPRWSTGSHGHLCTETLMQPDGNVVGYQVSDDAGAGVVFSTGTHGSPGSRLVVQADGNVVVYAPDGRAVFASRR